jgi:hypothetical protein
MEVVQMALKKKRRCPNGIDSIRKGRAIQMNVGAKAATGNILYFLHCGLPLGILTALSMILFKTESSRVFQNEI